MKLFNLPKISDSRGSLSFIESESHIDFLIKRVFWIYDVPGGESRGGHAYKESSELIIALSGSFEVFTDNGEIEKTYFLNRSYNALHIPAGTWRQMLNFSTNSLALVISSTFYSENDYIRDYNKWKNFDVNNDLFVISHSNFKSKCLNDLTIDFKLSKIEDCNLINLPINHKIKGNLTVIENNLTIPFKIKRVYYLYDIPGGESRGGHAHKNLYQLLIAASGSFDVILDDGVKKKKYSLNRPYEGILIVPGIWREIENFSSGSICLVLASEKFDEDDYIRDLIDFKLVKL